MQAILKNPDLLGESALYMPEDGKLCGADQ